MIASGSTLRWITAGACFAATNSRAAASAGANPAVAVTAAPKAPKDCARAAKSGLRSSVPSTRSGKSRSWCMRIVPYMPLSNTTTMNPAPYCTAVASSWPVIRNSPSPARHSTGRSGCAIAAATAEGSPAPIAPEVGASCERVIPLPRAASGA